MVVWGQRAVAVMLVTIVFVFTFVVLPLAVAWVAMRVFLLAKWKPRTLPRTPEDFGLTPFAERPCDGSEGASLPPAENATGPRVAVIGAGPAGCMAAWLLAATGRRVTVLEAQGEVGGRTCTCRTPHGRSASA